MSFLEILFLAFGLAADAFAVSVSSGSTGVIKDHRQMFRLSFHFGLFQFLMPVLGWLAGLSIDRYVQSFDHWIAFILLVWVAIRMFQSSKKGDEFKKDPSKGLMLLTLSIATSLDALAVGLSLAFLQVSIWYPAVVIGIVTSATSFLGILMGRRFSGRIGKRSSEIGAVMLILIGIKILITHLFQF